QSIHGPGWFEHKKVLNLIDIFVNPQWHLVSADAYNKLDDATRAAFDQAMVDMERMLREGYFLADYEAWRDAQLRLGVKTFSPPKSLRDQMATHAQENIWPAWIEKSGGDKGKAVLDQILELKQNFEWN
ncbi:MAG: hypothetical protein ACR2RL_01500, partial [Gammaproteobacteria bacterium]